MASIQLSSGDLTADRRADYAEMVFADGAMAAAADLLADTLGLVPTWAAGWFRLGEMREAAGERAAAADAFAEALRLDPADRLGASLKLGLLGAAHAIDAPPSAFVETLFDQYADRFDKSLVERLAYRVPDLIAEALEAAGARAFAHVVDLGCGTGLMGERLRHAASFLDGIDISAGMLKKAEGKRIYDRLSRQDLQTFDPEAFGKALQGGAPGAARADLVVAADVFLYVGALERIVAAVATMLPESGLFAFSVERHDGPEPMVLLASRRYAHSEAPLRDLLAAAGFTIISLRAHTIRMDRGEPIEGLIVVARKGRGDVLSTPVSEDAALPDEGLAALPN
ncbi:methyltransferase domain-containing protein [Aquibium carbonis]|uniref:Methyltransferase domain-containing protein n=1 Tax=Aquibium carbonis TaxID=2495581 RepID=A0A429YZM0_9HYPH|nr:methyltransferase [Aquibium carbonis]RST86917.1 methyltransferase domain-containing protein [Aquibium carbonis]